MKQNKLKTLALVLALALVLTLAVCMLVACNPKDSNSIESGDSSAVFSLEQYNALFGYLYSEDLDEDDEADLLLYYYSQKGLGMIDTLGTDPIEAIEEATGASAGIAVAEISVIGGEYDETTEKYSKEKKALVVYASSPEEASSALEVYLKDDSYLFEEGEGVKSTVGNIAVLESEKGLFENHIAKATLPSTVSDARRQQLKQAYDKFNSFGGAAEFHFNSEERDWLEAFFDEEYGNGESCFGYYWVPLDEISSWQQDWEEEKNRYTGDSYFDTTREEGYVFRYVMDKPGFTYEVIKYGENTGKFRITDYTSAENTVENLTIPARIDGKEIVEVNLDPYRVGIKNLTVEEGITYLRFSSYFSRFGATESITLPASISELRLSCPALKTINYAGSTADFEAKFANYANDWCHVQAEWDNTTHQYIYKDITITVVCNDGSLTYPQKDAQD